ncbi:MAG TPA: energy transducer TonB, partial [Lysobacter sp.]|nr:energy transducer TonB [Lysobacter sp.]
MSDMAATAANPAGIGSEQRLGATLALSLALHAIVLLGIGFTLERAAPVMPTLDVILTETVSPLTPKQADFLAQAANQGSGEHERSARPREDQTGPVPKPEAGVAPRSMRAQSPEARPAPQARVVSSTRG